MPRPAAHRRGMATEALIAHVVVSKFVIPFRLTATDVEVPSGHHAGPLNRRWVGRACWWLAPLLRTGAEHRCCRPIRCSLTSTTLPVLDPGRGRPKRRLWGYAVDNWHHGGDRSHHGSGLRLISEGPQGGLVSGPHLKAFRRLFRSTAMGFGSLVKAAPGCGDQAGVLLGAHARRKFYEFYISPNHRRR